MKESKKETDKKRLIFGLALAIICVSIIWVIQLNLKHGGYMLLLAYPIGLLSKELAKSVYPYSTHSNEGE